MLSLPAVCGLCRSATLASLSGKEDSTFTVHRRYLITRDFLNVARNQINDANVWLYQHPPL
jgi:hypothetical protein